MREVWALLGIIPLLCTAAAYAAEPDAGAALLQKCQICHTLETGGPPKVGPNLNGIFGRKAGTAPGFSYSDAMKNSGIVWDGETMGKFLRDPRGSMPGNRMSFPGIADDATVADLLARLRQSTQ